MISFELTDRLTLETFADRADDASDGGHAGLEKSKEKYTRYGRN